MDLFDELLSICLDRVADGDTVADCMADFPDCPELARLLETAAALMVLRDERPSRPGPRPSRGCVAAPSNESRLRWTA